MDYLSIRELAEMQLSGLPTTERRIREKAKKENWQCRKHQGRGGGMEYAVSSLPQPIQQAITAKQTADLLAQARQPETSSPATLPAPQEAQLPLSLESQTAALNQLTHKQKNCASARCAIVQDILHNQTVFPNTTTSANTPSSSHTAGSHPHSAKPKPPNNAKLGALCANTTAIN